MITDDIISLTSNFSFSNRRTSVALSLKYMLILTILVFPDIPSITFFDRNIEPADSHIDPSKNATPNVTVFAPTGVPQELAESFAPTAKERINPNRNAAKIV